jgi:hypothetical protein
MLRRAGRIAALRTRDTGMVRLLVRVALAMATSAGLVVLAMLGSAPTEAASATLPALHIHDGAKWSAVQAQNNYCEVLTFKSNGTFHNSSNHLDNGTWSGGGAKMKMKWTSGLEKDLGFKGTYQSSPDEYSGKFTYQGTDEGPGQLVEGDVC